MPQHSLTPMHRNRVSGSLLFNLLSYSFALKAIGKLYLCSLGRERI